MKTWLSALLYNRFLSGLRIGWARRGVKSSSPRHRLAAIAVVKRICDWGVRPDALDIALGAAEDPVAAIRHVARSIIERQRCLCVSASLDIMEQAVRSMMQNSDPALRREAMQYDKLPAYLCALGMTDPDEETRHLAARNLCSENFVGHSGKVVLPVVIQGLENQDPFVLDKCIVTLDHILGCGHKIPESLTNTACASLARVVQRHPDLDRRWRAARALHWIGDQGLTVLLEQMHSEDPFVSAATVRTLCRDRSLTSAQRAELIAIVSRLATHESRDVRSFAEETIEELRKADAGIAEELAGIAEAENHYPSLENVDTLSKDQLVELLFDIVSSAHGSGQKWRCWETYAARLIGRELDKRGGFGLMLRVATERLRQYNSDRWLDGSWDGIGGWRG